MKRANKKSTLPTIYTVAKVVILWVGIVSFSLGVIIQVAFLFFTIFDWKIYDTTFLGLIPLFFGYLLIRIAGQKLRKVVDVILEALVWLV